MENLAQLYNIDFVILPALILFSVLFIEYLYLEKKYKKKYKEILRNEILQEIKLNNVNIKNSEDLLNFLDRILLLKFEFYLNSDLVAYFLADKEIPSNIIKEIKSRYYLDVSTTLNDSHKEAMLDIFTPVSIEIYIHQVFLKLLNEASLKLNNNNNNNQDIHPSTLREILKG